jgi:hypothetical protein
MPSQEEIIESVIQALESINIEDPASDGLASYLYVVKPELLALLNIFQQILDIQKPSPSQLQERGRVLEKIVYWIFRSLKGCTTFKNFQSAGPQYDLFVTGDNQHWQNVIKFFYLDFNKRDIIIEAKAKNERLPDKDFARLCSIMECNLTNAGLGIFFTLRGATGFPENSKKRQRCLQDCRLRQVIFYARTGKCIVVLDKDDIFSLGENGTFIKLLSRKVRDARELSGLPTVPIEEVVEIDLPDYLKVV